MTPDLFYARIYLPSVVALTHDVTWRSDTTQSRCLLMAIAGQESAWTDRSQVPGGQAHGFWQCEQGGVVHGVMVGAFAAVLANVCDDYQIPNDEASVFAAIEYHDPLAYTVARLALRMDPGALPLVGDVEGAWNTYLRVWRPGKPSRDRWSVVYPQAVACLS